MALTLRNDAKQEIINILRKQGYPTYARLVDLFDIYLSDDPEVIGYMLPGQSKIVLNKDLNINQVSTIVRHEVLHEYLTHGPRQAAFDAAHPELHPELAGPISNIAADYEISNKGYTDADKSIARAIKLGDKILRGLVTEDEYPDWQDMTYEQMYQKLLEKDNEDREQLSNLLNQIGQISKQDLDDMQQDAQDIQSNVQDLKKEIQQGSSSMSSEEKENAETQADALDKAAEKAEQEAESAKDELSNAEENSSKSDNVFDTPKEQRDKVDVAARAKKIRDFIEDLKNKEKIVEENIGAIRKEKTDKAAKDIERYQGSGLNQFKLNLNRFIADQIGEFEDDSYARIHPSYEDSEFLVPGKLVREEKNIPLINVYHDVSGSFSDPKKTAAAFKAIESLNQYVRDGDIEIKVYYFANRVTNTRNGAGGGTEGQPILDHIEETNPTNVIVITDSDISDCRSYVTVPGAVWMLFYDSRSSNLMEHLHGKKQTKHYDIIY